MRSRAVVVFQEATLDHGRFEYSAIARRPKWELPHGARVAVWITPNVEHFHYDKPAMSMTPMTAGLRPDVLNYAWRDYGARVGIWRLMEILDRQGFVATAALNSEACLHYPAIIEAGNKLHWEWMAHGQNNSSLHTGMPEESRTRHHQECARHDCAQHGPQAARLARTGSHRDRQHPRPSG